MIDELIDPPSVKSGNALQRRVAMSDESLLWGLSPFNWEHTNLAGD